VDAGYTLAGTLHLPASAGPLLAVLMLQGSCAADRNSGDFFPPIRRAFLSRGLAVYAFDKPGLVESSGDWRRCRAALQQAFETTDVIGREGLFKGVHTKRLKLDCHAQRLVRGTGLVGVNPQKRVGADALSHSGRAGHTCGYGLTFYASSVRLQTTLMSTDWRDSPARPRAPLRLKLAQLVKGRAEGISHSSNSPA
jgi:hypothetical protein